MKKPSPVLLKLAELYGQSAAGRHGAGKLDFQPSIEDLLGAAGCREGEARELAERACGPRTQAQVSIWCLSIGAIRASL